MGLFSRLRGKVDQIQALQEQAQVFAAAQGYGPDGQPLPPGAPRPQLDPTALLPPASEFVKRSSCAFCGAPKQLPSVREYLYCDFCGQLLDYDLRQASANALLSPDSTAFAQAANQAGPEAAQALEAGNRERFRQLQYYLAEMRATYARWSVPPRAWNDERYRNAWIAFTAETVVAVSFDPAYATLDRDMRRLCLGLKWQGGDMLKMAMGAMGGGYSADAMPKVEPASFWPLVDVILAQTQRTNEVLDTQDLRRLDPDSSPASIADRMTRSVIAQGWLKSLEPDAGLELIGRLGLSHEYFRPEVVGERRGCGGCGGTLTLLPGATCAVCDGCGRRVEVGAAELSCVGCGGRLSLPEGTDRVNCPWCQGEVRRT